MKKWGSWTPVVISLALIFLLEAACQGLYFVRHFPKTYGYFNQPKAFTKFSLYGGYEYIPGVSVDLRGIGYPVDSLGVDRYGFVHNGYDRPIQPDDKIILLLGGSTVEGRGVSSNSHTIAARLEILLEKRFPARKIRVLNGGREGYISYQQLAFLSGKVPQFLKPAYVIALDGRNDANTVIGHADSGWRPNWKPYFDRLTDQVNRRMMGAADPFSEFHDWLVRHSAMAGLLSRLLRPEPGISLYAPQEKSPEPEILRRAAKAYLANHAVAHTAARMMGAHYYVFLQPVLLESRKPLTAEEKQMQKKWEKHYKQPFLWPSLENFFDEIARQAEGMDFFYDISHVFEGVTERTYWDNCHYNDSGNEIIARKIFSVIEKGLEDKK